MRRVLSRVAGGAGACALAIGVLAGCGADKAEPQDVAAPSGGSVTETLEPVESTTLDPVGIGTEAKLGDGVVMSVVDSKRVEIKEVGPGEVAGSAIAVTLRLRNDTDKDLDVDGAYVNLVDAHGMVIPPSTASPAKPLAGTVGPGKEAEGIYVFVGDDEQMSAVTITATHGAGVPIAQFTGSLI